MITISQIRSIIFWWAFICLLPLISSCCRRFFSVLYFYTTNKKKYNFIIRKKRESYSLYNKDIKLYVILSMCVLFLFFLFVSEISQNYNNVMWFLTDIEDIKYSDRTNVKPVPVFYTLQSTIPFHSVEC